jgi:hypothetical protein
VAISVPALTPVWFLLTDGLIVAIRKCDVGTQKSYARLAPGCAAALYPWLFEQLSHRRNNLRSTFVLGTVCVHPISVVGVVALKKRCVELVPGLSPVIDN